MNKTKLAINSIEQKSTQKISKKFEKRRNLVIKFLDNYSVMISEARATKGKAFSHPNKCFKKYECLSHKKKRVIPLKTDQTEYITI